MQNTLQTNKKLCIMRYLYGWLLLLLIKQLRIASHTSCLSTTWLAAHPCTGHRQGMSVQHQYLHTLVTHTCVYRTAQVSAGSLTAYISILALTKQLGNTPLADNLFA